MQGMTLLQRFSQFIKEENLFQKIDWLLLAVSGGIDSVVLCELCRQSGFKFIIAHCNFQLRRAESTRDEHFVRELAEKYEVPVYIKKFETNQYALENKLSIQVAARELRYTWFNEILGDKALLSKYDHPKYLLTAHHAGDNIETMLMNLFKGTGITGLRAMLPKQNRIIRPLLFAHKTDILDFSINNDLNYVEDSSNESDKYTRNYFRNQLLPAVQQVFPGVEENLAGNLKRFRETEQLFRQAIEQHKKKLLEIKGNEVHIAVLKLKKLSPLETIIYEVIKEYGFTARQTIEVIGLLEAESGKYVQSASYRIIKNRNWLIISPNNNDDSQTIIINKKDKKLTFEKGLLEFKEVPVNNYQMSTSSEVAQLDAGEVIFPLILRKRRQSDYFYPLGMQKKKKLNRFLSDQKLSLTEKEQVWLIEMNKKIIWITGRRIDDRFKVTGKTTKVLQIRFTPGG